MASMPTPIVAQAQVDAAGEATTGVGLNPAVPEVAVVDIEPADNTPFRPDGLGKIALKWTVVALLA
jgi:hypothetical protein